MKVVGSMTTRYFWGHEFKTGWTKLFVRLGSLKLAEYSGNTTRFFHADQLGSPRVRTDMSGTADAAWDNLPFGETWASSGTSGDQHRYTGHLRDAETGNDYAGARYYASRAGRWLSVDSVRGSIRDPQSTNRYRYVRNDPVNLVDPDGRQECPYTACGSVTQFGPHPEEPPPPPPPPNPLLGLPLPRWAPPLFAPLQGGEQVPGVSLDLIPQAILTSIRMNSLRRFSRGSCIGFIQNVLNWAQSNAGENYNKSINDFQFILGLAQNDAVRMIAVTGPDQAVVDGIDLWDTTFAAGAAAKTVGQTIYYNAAVYMEEGFDLGALILHEIFHVSGDIGPGLSDRDLALFADPNATPETVTIGGQTVEVWNTSTFMEQLKTACPDQ